MLAGFEVEGHHLELLRQATKVADRVAELDRLVDRDGTVLRSPHGDKAHPALVESRNQRALLARLVAALGLPDVDDVDGKVDGRTRGKPRAPYRLHAVGDR